MHSLLVVLVDQLYDVSVRLLAGIRLTYSNSCELTYIQHLSKHSAGSVSSCQSHLLQQLASHSSDSQSALDVIHFADNHTIFGGEEVIF